MKKRVGNDIPFSWTLRQKPSGLPYDLTGEKVSVNMKLSGQCIEIPMDCTVEVNVIRFTFYGKDQPGTGKYDLLLRIYDAERKVKVTYDVANVVELVPHSWLETDEGSVDIESDIATNGEINVIETIKVNGVALEVTDKAVDITVPTDLADLQDDATHRLVTDAEKATWNDKDTFWAVYDSTTSAQIEIAFQAGKAIFVFWNNRVYRLIYRSASGTAFTFGYVYDGTSYRINVSSSNEWTNTSVSLQQSISDLATIRSGAALGATALQTETDPTVPAWAKAVNKPSYTAQEVGALPANTPIPDPQIQSDWNQSDTTAKDYIKNKPAISGGSKMYVGTCPTAAATVEKIVTVETFPTVNGEPVVGTTIAVKFEKTNTAGSPTLNVNGLGAKSIFVNTAVYTSSSSYAGYAGRYDYYVWDGTYWVWMSHGTDADTNTIGYTIRTNVQRLPVSSTCYRYRLLFTSANGQKRVPANNSTSTNATASRTVNQEKIDPFGDIYYYATTAALAADAQPSASYLYQQGNGISLGYSFNRTGEALVLNYFAPIYIKCAPQTDGSAIIDADTPYVQALPATNDGKIYIFLGIATSATAFELTLNHPVYYHDGTALRMWTGRDCYVKPSTGIPASDLASGVIPTVHNVPSGGTAGQVLGKASGTDYDVEWVDQGGEMTVVNVSEASATIAAQMGTIYNWTVNPTSINVTLPSAPIDVAKEFVLKFSALLSVPQMTLPVNISWKDNVLPLPRSGYVYEIRFSYNTLGGWLGEVREYLTDYVILPAGYTAYTWIGKPSGTAYIDTGYVPTDKPRVVTEFMFNDTIVDADLFGSAGSPLFIFNPGPGNYDTMTLYYKYGSRTSGNVGFSASPAKNQWYSVDAADIITVGTETISWATSWDYSSNTASIRLFGGRNNTVVNFRLNRTKIYDGNNLVRDLIPCTNDQSEAGMYDIVTQTFYGSAVSGQTFSVGNN